MPWQPCLVCEEETSNYCRYCAQTRNDGTIINARFYCDLECRDKDESEHLRVHKTVDYTMAPNIERARKAGRIAQSLFYAFMENTWTYDIKKVCIRRDQDHCLVAVEVTDGAGVVAPPGGHTDCKTYAGGWLIKFPSDSFGGFEQDSKHALLTDHSSVWAFVVMHAAIQALFKGTPNSSCTIPNFADTILDLVNDVQTDIKEVVHYPAEKVSRIVHAQGVFGSDTRRHDQLYPDEDERGSTKGVYEIVLKCGSKIALDLAGAQWNGQDDNDGHAPVTFWADYWSRWGADVKYRIPFRSHALKHCAKMASYRVITSQTLIMETMIYFNVFMSSACQAELQFDPRELLDMDKEKYRAAKRCFLEKAVMYLQRRPEELDNGDHRSILNAFDLRHPMVIANAPRFPHKPNGSLPPSLGDMSKFDWKALSRLIQQPNSAVPLKEKKQALALKKKRSVYKEPGSWQLIFLEETLPGPRIPAECFSENPGWKLG